MVRTVRSIAVTCALAASLYTLRGGAQAPAGPGDAGQPAQQPTPPPQEQPTAPPDQQPVFRAGINFVRVDVIVTDSSGNPVGDLTAEDFEVVEDGRLQKIETFKLVQLDGGRVAAAVEAPRPIRSDFDEEAEAARDDVRLFAIFLDDYHVRRGSSMAVRKQLADFVATQLGPSDMIGLMYPLESLGSVRMTRDHAAVARGIQQFVGRKFDYEPRNQYEQQYFQYPTEVVERIRNQVSMSALRALITRMGSLKEGRKALILVSEGFTALLPPQMRNESATNPGSGNPSAFDPMAGTGSLVEDRAAWAAGLDLEHELRNVYNDANRHNVAIYAVDPRGIAPMEFDLNERVGLQTDASYLRSTIDTLRMLAENSDGRAIVNTNDLASGMKQIVRDTSAYYLLGYSSSDAPSDGKFHEIEVRVKRPGVQVRSRKGYWALTAEETARALAPPKPGPPEEVTAALAAVSAPVRSRIVRTWIGTTRGEGGKTKVTFAWEPLPRVAGDPRASETPARVSLMAIGDDGAPYFRGRVPASAPGGAGTGVTAGRSGTARQTPAAAAGQPQGPSSVTFEIPPGTIQLRMSVEDADSQVLDSETREITVPDFAGAQTSIGTPAIHRARTVRELEALKNDVDAVPAVTREFNRTDRLLIRVPVYGPGIEAPAVTARILNRAGQPMFDLPDTAQPAPMHQGRFELLLSRLAPGEYLIEIAASGEGGEARQLVGFRVIG
jgi:VWFA-related protein